MREMLIALAVMLGFNYLGDHIFNFLRYFRNNCPPDLGSDPFPDRNQNPFYLSRQHAGQPAEGGAFYFPSCYPVNRRARLAGNNHALCPFRTFAICDDPCDSHGVALIRPNPRFCRPHQKSLRRKWFDGMRTACRHGISHHFCSAPPRRDPPFLGHAAKSRLNLSPCIISNLLSPMMERTI